MQPFEPPQWSKPAPPGSGHAADAAHFVAAPLLASAGAALIGVVGADSEKFRWPGMILLLLCVAVLALVGSVQAGFQARERLYSVGDLEAWWGRPDLERHQDALREQQRRDYGKWQAKIKRAVGLYNFGVVVLGAALALCVVPLPGTAADEAVPRWIACALVGSAVCAESLWAVLAPRDFQPPWRR